MWILKMAWRDSRGSRRQLTLFLSSMVAGVAALVAILSFGANLEEAIDQESQALLGADLVLERRSPFPREIEAVIDSLGGRQSRRVSFTSMAYFPRTAAARLSTVRAIEGEYPFYGNITTTPPDAADRYLDDGEALVDATLMKQLDVHVGDSVQIGNVTYRVAGSLDRTPRENEMMSLFSPRIYVPRSQLDVTLLARGSRADFDVFFHFEDGRDVEATVEQISPVLRQHQVRSDTVEETKANWDEALTNLYRFLSIVAFVAVLLGGVGVASAIHVYVRRRFETIAILRCLGAVARRTFAVYALQAGVMGLIGGILGAAAGIGVQALVPFVLKEFLPVTVPFNVAWNAVFGGVVLGVGVTILFALLPLVSIRKISPLLTLRSTVEHSLKPARDPLWWFVLALIVSGLTAFAVAHAPEPSHGLGYAAALLGVFLALIGVARLIMWGARRFVPGHWPYPWRQGMANLFRPNNQTGTLMTSLGLGTFLIATLFGVQRTLLNQIEVAGGDGRPNVVLYDIQVDELDAVRNIAQKEGLTIVDSVPIITMRLVSVNGRTVEEMRQDSTADVTWAHRREYRSTYRDYVSETERIVAGEFVGRVDGMPDLVPISLEYDLAGQLNVGLGDTLVFDVQGLRVPSVVSSLREVNWRRISTNFFVVFPSGVLEEAPQFYVLLNRADSDATSARAQQAVFLQYPTVSAIDLSLVLSTFDAIFSRVSFVVRFMASFSILTGLIVLVGAVAVSRLQRVRESVLLKTLGASRRQVLYIMLTEYLFLGFFAALTGLLLAMASGWALAEFVFETSFRPDVISMIAILAVVPALTMAIGWSNSRGVYDRPPLDVLRTDV